MTPLMDGKGRDVLITGMGAVTAIGTGVASVSESLRSCRSGIALPSILKTVHASLPVAEVKYTDDELKSMLDGTLPVPELSTRACLLGMLALDEALQSASLEKRDPGDIVFVSATAVGGMDLTELYYDCPEAGKQGFIVGHDCGATTDTIAARYGGFAMSTTVSTACSAALNAIIFGCSLIKSGRASIVVAGGTECLTKYHLNGFNSLRILDSRRCRPFDRGREGLNLGEGAGFLVLESPSSASRRNVRAIASVAGCANRCDAYHQTASSPSGEGARLCMEAALEDAGLLPADIDYVNAHGTGTPNNDLSEGIALERVFGASVPPVSSTKAFTGHTTAASGAIESIISLIAMKERFLPVSLGFSKKMEELSFEPVREGMACKRLDRVMVNAFGFGGNDSCVIYENIIR